MQFTIPDSVRHIADSADHKFIWHFFVFFSRFEYALKRDERYLKCGTGKAEPDWDCFASDQSASFEQLADPDLAKAIDYFKQSPPQKQLRKDGHMDWSNPVKYDPNDHLLVWLLQVIRIVRNNLFHGGKFPGILVKDPSRDRDLIQNAITVLSASLTLDHRIKLIFSEEF